MSSVCEETTFEYEGHTYMLELSYDNTMRAPWVEYDVHGPVSNWTDIKTKRPGQMILAPPEGQYVRLYDFEEATKIAKRDRWGLGDRALERLRLELGREPTRKQIVRQAVFNDFEYLRAWCNDEWHWVILRVYDRTTGVEELMGGMESNDEDGIKPYARELAEEIYPRVVAALLTGEVDTT
jgi:hypothetical protein